MVSFGGLGGIYDDEFVYVYASGGAWDAWNASLVSSVIGEEVGGVYSRCVLCRSLQRNL